MTVIVHSIILLFFGPRLPEEDEALWVFYYDFVCGVADGGKAVCEGWPGGEDVRGVGTEGYYVSEGFDCCIGF